jgi:glycosyltransferase involved in cell wall biosynthesis
LRIGVDATSWQNKRGYGRHARALLNALVHSDTNNRYTFFMDSAENKDSLPPGIEVCAVRSDAPTVVAASANGHRSAADMWRMSRALSHAQLDLILFPTVYTYVPVLTRAKKIVMIHDVIAEKYPALTLPRRSARWFWKTKVALGRWQADAIATVSDYSRHQIVEHFEMDAEWVHVVGEASDAIFRRLENPQPTQPLTALGLTGSQPMIVYVGGFGPHKNLGMLLKAFEKVCSQPRLSDVKLVLVGEYKKEVFHSYSAEIRRQVTELKLVDRVLFTGYLADDDLVVLLNLATVGVLPSLMEGFGLPAVEAAACGCPVIATKESPLPALLGEGALYFDPTNQEDLERALSRVLESEPLRHNLSTTGRTAATRLTWEAAAQQMMALIRKVTAE